MAGKCLSPESCNLFSELQASFAHKAYFLLRDVSTGSTLALQSALEAVTIQALIRNCRLTLSLISATSEGPLTDVFIPNPVLLEDPHSYTGARAFPLSTSCVPDS